MSVNWNPWHGCRKVSEGCRNCYVYRQDAQWGADSMTARRTGSFNLPVRRSRDGRFKIPAGEMVYTCFTSDFLLADADEWRTEAWRMMALRRDLHFMFFTKRIERFAEVMPNDWGDGWDNVTVGCTVENQQEAERRLPLFKTLPIKHKIIICAPLVGPIDLSRWLDSGIEEVSVGGESGSEARICDYDWVLNLRRQCEECGVPFCFHQTGARLLVGGRLYRIRREHQHSQALRAGINFRLDRPLR